MSNILDRSCWLLLIIGVRLSVVDSAIDVGPRHSAVVTGQSTTLHCNATLTVNAWNFVPFTGAAVQLIAGGGCAIQSGYAAHYSVDGQCQLTITSATATEAGHYFCQDTLPASSSPAYVTVVDAPRGSQSPSYVAAGDSLSVSCSTNYSTYTPSTTTGVPIPLLRWTNLDGLSVTFLSNSTATNPTSTAISISVPPGSGDVHYVTCEVYFNTPVVFTSASWNSNATTISYCPTVIISNDSYDGVIHPNTTFLCSAQSYPPVSLYQWAVHVGNGTTTTNSQTFKLTTTGSFNISCTATNYLYGGTTRPCSSTEYVSGTSVGPYATRLMLYISMLAILLNQLLY